MDTFLLFIIAVTLVLIGYDVEEILRIMRKKENE